MISPLAHVQYLFIKRLHNGQIRLDCDLYSTEMAEIWSTIAGVCAIITTVIAVLSIIWKLSRKFYQKCCSTDKKAVIEHCEIEFPERIDNDEHTVAGETWV